MLTAGSYFFLRLLSYVAHPESVLYGVSHFGIVVIALSLFCIGCIRMCHDQSSAQQVTEQGSNLRTTLKEIHQLTQELQRLDLSIHRDQVRLQEITKRLEVIRQRIENITIP